MLQWEDFEKMDIRVGTVIEVNDFPRAKKPAYQLTINFGSLGIKHSSAQVTTLYTKEALTGKQVIAVINFEPKNIAGFMSECLVLGVYNGQGEVILLQPEREVENGMKVG